MSAPIGQQSYIYVVIRIDDETVAWAKTFTDESRAEACLSQDYEAEYKKIKRQPGRRIDTLMNNGNCAVILSKRQGDDLSDAIQWLIVRTIPDQDDQMD